MQQSYLTLDFHVTWLVNLRYRYPVLKLLQMAQAGLNVEYLLFQALITEERLTALRLLDKQCFIITICHISCQVKRPAAIDRVYRWPLAALGLVSRYA